FCAFSGFFGVPRLSSFLPLGTEMTLESNIMRGCLDFQAASRLTRRRLIQAGFAGVAGLGLPAWLRSAESGGAGLRARAKHLIFLHQFGGPSHLDTFDMKPDAPSGIRGEFSPISSAQPGLRLTEHLPRFATV